MSLPLDLTIAIPVKNEEVNLSGCLQSIGIDLAKFIVVIDSNSTDGTEQVARQFGTEFVNFTWNGRYPKKRNWFIQNYKPKTKWILFLDADEYLTEDFKLELRTSIEQDNRVGYWLKYTIYFLGKPLKGGYPLNKLALFRVGAGEYERIEEDQWSHLDMEIHEHPVLQGETGAFRSKIDHRDFRSVSQYVIKHNEYAAWEAGRFLKAKQHVELYAKWTWKQRVKYQVMNTVLIGPVYFLGSFVLYAGFRDGARGLVFAILKMSYFTQVYCKIRENELYNRDEKL